MTRTTIRDVAERAGVSVATVSYVMNDRPGSRIPPETVQRVREAAALLDYRTSSLARSLRTQTSSTIGFISDKIATTPYAVQMVEAAGQAARERGFLTILINTDGDPLVEQEAIAELGQHHVDQVIYAFMHHQQVTIPARLGPNTVLLDATERPGDGFRGAPSVVPDERGAARDAVRHLTALGHRRIALITEHDESSAAIPLRLAGYRDALEEVGIAFDADLVSYGFGRGDAEGGERAVRALHSSGQRPTALFCFNDRMAMGAYRALRHLGLDIPRDVSVVGFDNLELIAGALDPPLTTAELPHAAMGTWAVETLLAHDRTTTEPQLMPCRLIVRESTGAPPA